MKKQLKQLNIVLEAIRDLNQDVSAEIAEIASKTDNLKDMIKELNILLESKNGR